MRNVRQRRIYRLRICSVRHKQGAGKTTYTQVTKIKLKKLKKGSRYQVQARDCTVFNGKIMYGGWSKVKTSKKIK